eukprot:22518-Eustigmatos_ZCMA.PRE.1
MLQALSCSNLTLLFCVLVGTSVRSKRAKLNGRAAEEHRQQQRLVRMTVSVSYCNMWMYKADQVQPAW